MKITEIKFNEDVLIITVLSDQPIGNDHDIVLFVDECSNIDNVQSTNEVDHDYVLDQYNSAIDVVLQENVNNLYTYAIYIEQEIISELDEHLKHFTLKVNDQIATSVYYDANAIYKAQMNKLRCVCDTCLDDHMMQKIMIITFRQQLLEQSICISHYIDAMNHYLDLCKMLDIQIVKYNKSDTQNNNTCVNCTGCYCCTGGVCKLK